MAQMSDIDKKREAIKRFFKDHGRVDRMSEAQIVAIYKRFQNEGKL